MRPDRLLVKSCGKPLSVGGIDIGAEPRFVDNSFIIRAAIRDGAIEIAEPERKKPPKKGD